MSNRRKLIIALGSGALTAPFGSFAQRQGKVWRIGFLLEREQPDFGERIGAFKARLRDLGYSEGRGYVIELRNANADLARLPELAAELLALKVDVIVAPGTSSAMAARNFTHDIPILIVTVGDPVGSGLATSLRRPGGSVTGLTNLSAALTTKHLDLLREMVPRIHRVGYLYNPDNAANVINLRQLESDCARLQFKSIRAPVAKAEDLAGAFNTLQRDKAQGLIVSGANTIGALQESILERVAKLHIPAVYASLSFVEAGGLISYNSNAIAMFGRLAIYADKIFKGEKPRDLPIAQPTEFELVVNAKAAKGLGIKIPDSILLRADKVIK